MLSNGCKNNLGFQWVLIYFSYQMSVKIFYVSNRCKNILRLKWVEKYFRC